MTLLTGTLLASFSVSTPFSSVAMLERVYTHHQEKALYDHFIGFSAGRERSTADPDGVTRP